MRESLATFTTMEAAAIDTDSQSPLTTIRARSPMKFHLPSTRKTSGVTGSAATALAPARRIASGRPTSSISFGQARPAPRAARPPPPSGIEQLGVTELVDPVAGVEHDGTDGHRAGPRPHPHLVDA